MLLKIENIKKSFLGKLLMEKVSYEFPLCGLVVLLGKSGSGKTTLFYMMLGLENLDEGKIFYKDKELKSEDDFLKFRKNCGFVFQEYGVLNYLSAKENLLIGGAEGESVPFLNEKHLSKMTSNLSGGEKQRLSIARELEKEPEILFCDEPTGSLDESNGNNIMSLLKEESKKRLVIVVTHNIELAYTYADTILEIKDQSLYVLKENKEIKKENTKKKIKKENLLNEFRVVFKSFFHEKVKMIFTFFAFLLSFSSLLLMTSMQNSTPLAINKATETIADAKRLKVVEMEKNKIEGTNFSLSKMYRPNKDVLEDAIGDLGYVSSNLDAFFLNAEILLEGKTCSLLLKSFPYGSTLQDIRANTLAGDLLSIGSNISIKIENKIETRFENKNVQDKITLQIDSKITYLYDEFDFLNYPILYISSDALKEYMEEINLPKASSLLKKEISLFERYDSYGDDEEEIKSYSYYVDVKERKNISLVKEKLLNVPLDENHFYEIESRYINTQNTLYSSMELIEMIMNIFSYLSIAISICLLYLFVISNYQARKKEFALYKTMGVKGTRIYYYSFIPLFIYTLCAFIFSFIPWKIGTIILGKLLFPYFGLNIFFDASFSLKDLGFFIIILLLISLFLAIFPYKKVKSLKVNEVIRSE